MPLPSKQNEIYATLLNDIRQRYYPGAKLPTERIYAQRLGVARQTLRSSLQRLADEKRIVREKSGTYVLDETTGHRPSMKDNPGPVHVLLPCPNFLEATNDSSIINQQNLILGAMRAAVEYGTQAVTIPVSESNNPDDINWNQLTGLRKNDIVLFTGHWFSRVVPLLVERRCRVGCVLNTDRGFPEIVESGIDFIEYRRPTLAANLPGIIRFLREQGAGNIACFIASVERDFYEYTDILYPELLRDFPFLRSENLGVTNSLNPFAEQLSELKKFCRNKSLDGLILVINTFKEQYVDLYRELNLPLSAKLIVEDTNFFDPANPKRNANIWLRTRPFAEAGFDMAKSLLSGRHGQDIREFEIKLIKQEEFPK